MKASEMTIEKFDEILPTLQFSLLTYPDRYAYEGAGPRCLIASTDEVVVLFENGEYTVVGTNDDDDFDPWNVMFNADSGERMELL